MNFKHAVGFLFLGTMLGLLPRIAPGWCHVTESEFASTRELWLQTMSFVQLGLAGVYFIRRLAAYLASVMEYSVIAVPVQEQLPDAVGEMAFAVEEIAVVPIRRPALAARLRPRSMLPLPVAFKSAGLLDQRAA